MRSRALLGLVLACLGSAATANCRLALALALDVSSSVDAQEYELQRIGLAQALNSDEVRGAILEGGDGAVALAVYEWSGFSQQKLQLDWVLLRSQDDISNAVEHLSEIERSYDEFPTSIGQALGYGATLLRRAPECTRKVIDVSGDGENNSGYGPEAAFRNFPFADVTVNGLAILGHSEDVLRYYHEEVARGPAAFVITATGFDDFQNAMTRKLYREINDIVLGGQRLHRLRQQG